jgi:hypothetical protein
VPGADFLAAFTAIAFLGACPPVDLRAVCLVRAIRDRFGQSLVFQRFINQLKKMPQVFLNA